MATKSQTLLASLGVTTGTTNTTAEITFDHPVNVVDVFEAGSYGTAGILTAQFSVDGGTVWYTVPQSSRAAGTGHIMSFVCWGTRLRFLLTDAGSATNGAIVLNVLTEAVSQSVVKQGAIGTAAANYAVTFNKPPEKILFVTQAGTWDTLDAFLDGSPDGGTTYYQMGAYGKHEEDEYILVDNPAKLKTFRVRTTGQDTGTLTAQFWVIGASQREQLRATRAYNPVAADATFDEAVAWNGSSVYPALTDATEIQADVDKIWAALESQGILPTREGAVNV